MSAVMKEEVAASGLERDRAEMARVFKLQKAHAIELRSSTAAERVARLRKLLAMVEKYRADIYKACYADFRKPESEVDLAEILPIITECKDAIRHVKKWMKPRHVMPSRSMLGTRSHVRHEPKGSTLIISPWNYPINLTFSPLVSAIAAGCTAMLKPSEMTPNCAALMKKMVAETFDEREVALFEGDVPHTTALLELPFDHIFFTGSPNVGKVVMAAAAKHLTSVTLELGGKSPVIVDKSANLKNAARSVVFGKYCNAGQTCIAPDYIYVEASVREQFLNELGEAISRSYGDAANQGSTPDYCRIVNARHYTRVKSLLEDAEHKGGRVAFGGKLRDEDNYVAPTVVTDINADMRLMQEEIFGPLLPVLTYTDVQQVIDHVNANPKPLALYVYARDNSLIKQVVENTSAGGSCINTCVVQYLHGNLPFGGVNNSGIGCAHGEWGFKAFSHERALVRDYFSVTLLLTPPYTGFVRRLLKLTQKLMT